MKNRVKPPATHQTEAQESSVIPSQQERPPDLATQAIQPGKRSVEADASLLGDKRLSSIQRQRMAARIGRLSGNQPLQRVIALTAGPQDKGDSSAVQLQEEGQAEAPAEGPADEPMTPVKFLGDITKVTPTEEGCTVWVDLPFGAWEENIIGFKVTIVENRDGVYKSVPVEDLRYIRKGTHVNLTIGGTPYRSQIRVEVEYQATADTADTAREKHGGSAGGVSDSSGETEQAEGQPEQQEQQEQQDEQEQEQEQQEQQEQQQEQQEEPAEELAEEEVKWSESPEYKELKTRISSGQIARRSKGQLRKVGGTYGLDGIRVVLKQAKKLVPSPTTEDSTYDEAMLRYIIKVYSKGLGAEFDG